MGVVPVTHGPAQILDGLLELVLQFSHLLPGGVQFLAKRLHVVLLGLLPCLMRGVKFLLRLRKQFLRLLTNGLFVILETQGHAALLLADLRHRDGFIRHTAQFGDEPEFFQCANRPLGGVKLPWLHAVAVVVLKLVVEVVVALAKGEQRHQPTVARGTACRVGLAAERVAEAVDEKGHVMHGHQPRHAADQQPGQGTDAALGKIANESGQPKADQQPDGHPPLVLEADKRIGLEIVDVRQGNLTTNRARHDPAHVRVKEATLNVVWIIVIVGVLVMTAMVGAPLQRRVFHGGGPKNQGQEANRPTGLEGEVGEKPVIPKCDTQAGGNKHSDE